MQLSRAIQNLSCRLACTQGEEFLDDEEHLRACQARCTRWQAVCEALTTVMHPSVPFDELTQAIYAAPKEPHGTPPEASVPQRCFLDCNQVDAERELRGVPPACYAGCGGWRDVSKAIRTIREALPYEVFKNYFVELYLATGRDVSEAMFIRLYDPQIEPRFPTASSSRVVLPAATDTPAAPGLMFRLCQFNRWMILVRWVLGGLIAVAALIMMLVLRLDFPYLGLLAASGAALALNVVHAHRFRGHRDLRLRYEEVCSICTVDFLQAQILSDFAVLAMLLILTGGMLSPLALFFFPHLFLSALLLPRRRGVVTTAVAVGIYAAVILMQLGGITASNSLTRVMAEVTGQTIAYPVFLLGFAVVAATLHLFTLQVGDELRSWQREVFAINDLSRERNEIVSRLNERLIRMDTIRQRMVRVVSHDLKSPIAAAEASIKVILGGFAGPLAPKQIGLLQTAVNRLAGMREFINEILDVATLEKESLKQELVPVNVTPLVQQVQADAEFAAAEKRLNLTFRIPAAPIYLQASPRRFVQVLQNLVTNAIKFTSTGGSVTVTAEARDRDVIFAVSDTGPGISPEDLVHVFDEFYRVKAARLAGVGGSGLGLYIVKSIVSAHGGTVWAESEVGRGSTFRFTMLRAEPPPGPPPDEPEVAPAAPAA